MESEEKVASLSLRLDLLKTSFEEERGKIEKTAKDQMEALKADLDATLAEKGEHQKEVYDKVEAHEK